MVAAIQITDIATIITDLTRKITHYLFVLHLDLMATDTSKRKNVSLRDGNIEEPATQ